MKKCAMMVLVSFAGLAHADAMPRMGGPMKHVMVELVGNELMVNVDGSVPMPELARYNEVYQGGAAVLNGVGYNSQYGWMVDGFWSLPPGGMLWIEQTSATAGLQVYSPGFSPILGTAGSPVRFSWDGRMLHNWYASAVSVPAGGLHEATYRVYLGDASGVPLAGFVAAEVALEWSSTVPVCPADFTGDGFVDDADFVTFAAAYEAFSVPPAEAAADLTGDGVVDDADFVIFASAYDNFACP